MSSKLERSRSAKVRISAALSLAKLDDKRAIRALSKALRRDKSADIRRISAASLGQRIARLDGKVRKDTLTALRDAASRDRDKNVRASAKVALSKSQHREAVASGSDQPRTRGILVEVSAPPSRSRRLSARTASLLQSTVKQVIREKAPSSVRSAPGTGRPSSKQLRQKGLAGYSVAPEVSELKMVRKGRQVVVQCQVRLQLSPWMGEGEKLLVEKTATVSGSGTVTSGSSKKAIANSSQECLTAVVTQVTANQVVPFLASKAR